MRRGGEQCYNGAHDKLGQTSCERVRVKWQRLMPQGVAIDWANIATMIIDHVSAWRRDGPTAIETGLVAFERIRMACCHAFPLDDDHVVVVVVFQS